MVQLEEWPFVYLKILYSPPILSNSQFYPRNPPQEYCEPERSATRWSFPPPLLHGRGSPGRPGQLNALCRFFARLLPFSTVRRHQTNTVAQLNKTHHCASNDHPVVGTGTRDYMLCYRRPCIAMRAGGSETKWCPLAKAARTTRWAGASRGMQEKAAPPLPATLPSYRCFIIWLAMCNRSVVSDLFTLATFYLTESDFSLLSALSL